MATVLRLEPESAALSVATKIATIKQLKAAIVDIVARYDGLTSFEAELEKRGVTADVAKLTAENQA